MGYVLSWLQLMRQLKPGDVIAPSNAAQVKDLVSPGVYYAVTHGMRMDIVAPERVDWPPPYREATEKYSQQVRLTNDHRSMVGYIAGQPFPLIDPNDPYVATKIIWNNVFRPISSDDYDLRFYDCQSEYVRPGQDQNMIDDIEIGHYAGYNIVGRTEVEPLPVDPDFKESGRLWLFALYPVLAPEESRGTGLDPLSLRRSEPRRRQLGLDPRHPPRASPERVDSFQRHRCAELRSRSLFRLQSQDRAVQLPASWVNRTCSRRCTRSIRPKIPAPTTAVRPRVPEAWELRHLYIVEATPRSDIIEAGGALDKLTDIYLDTEVWFEPYVDTYDQKGRLWRTHIYWLAFRDRPVPDARVAIYPFKREFVVGAASIDTQGNFSTMCYLPGQHTPERECWYINMGAIDKDFCTVKSMVAAAP